MVPQPTGVRLYPVYLTDAHGPHEFTLTIIGDPEAAAGAVQVHVVYPAGAPTVAETDYPMLMRLFAAHLLAHADQYDTALAAQG
jgi:hypothetical protein